MVDPILSLAVAIAEGRKTYAVFLGSGVSKAAGILTGTDILWDTIKKIYKLEKDKDKDPNDNEVKDWFEKSEFKDFTYSKILETICPSQEERRQFLEKYFVGKNPTDTHRCIADMVRNGLLKVIITTNFDRLMEKALDAIEVKYDVVSSPAELKVLKAREHSPCRVLKLHGDYQSGEIKNTEKELVRLEPKIEKEFKEILNRYGIVVIGYSGQDEGVMRCLEKRNSKYTLYWLKKENICERVDRLLKQQDGKVIERENSDAFVKELVRKIEIFSLYEAGDTPEYLMHLTKQFIKENDEVGFWEEVKKQLKEVSKSWQEIYKKIQNERMDKKIKDDLKRAQDGVKELEIHTDKILGIGLVLVEYEKKENFKNFLRVFQELYEMYNNMSVNWQDCFTDILFAIIHNVFYTLGALALRDERFEIIKELLSYRIRDRKIGKYESILVQPWMFYPISFGEKTDKAFEYLINMFNNKEFLKEYFRSKDKFSCALCEFNCLLNIYERVKNLKSSGRYCIYPMFIGVFPYVGKVFEDRLKDNEFLRNIAEEICGVKIETFKKNWPLICTDIIKQYGGIYRNTGLGPDLFTESSDTGVVGLK
ncbi:MAG TPA: SIR2 family protein [Candidatus Brocadiia bacterium]|nr:SIR2 family protein [Candidatus Brocadiales bacterium]